MPTSGLGMVDRRPPAVSVIIVNYRAYEELGACLDSLSHQTLPDVDVIVVDHASNHEACEQLRRRFPFARIFESAANPGFAAGVNRGARESRAEYLYLLNPDAVVDADVCAALSTWLA